MSTLLKKLTLSFLICLTLFVTVLPNFLAVKADIPTPANDPNNIWIHQWYGETNPFSWYTKVYDVSTSPSSEIFGERYTAAQVQWVIYGLFSFFWNLIPGNPDLTVCFAKGDIATCMQLLQRDTNAMLQLGNLPPITGSTNSSGSSRSFLNLVGQNPISGIAYVKNLASKLALVTPVEAQGFGYTTANNSIVKLWQISRNISFALIILIVIVLSFLIMFRVKINPQVVITFQSAIPRLIIGLILITFSYAIAGFAVDLMYIVIGILATFLKSANLSGEDAVQLFKDFTTTYRVDILMGIYWMNLVGAAFSTIFKGGFGVGFLVTFLAIIAFIAVLWWSIKIVFVVIKNFVMLILTIAIGPLEIMLGIITNGSGFGSWFKKLISYLAVYPVMGLMFFFSFFFLYQGGGLFTGNSTSTTILPFKPVANVIGQNAWVPPFTSITDNASSLIWVLVSFFVFSEIANVAEIVQKFVEGKQWEYGSAVGNVGGGARSMFGSYTELAKSNVLPSGGKTTQGIINALKWLLILGK